jgi:hypothetical protein
VRLVTNYDLIESPCERTISTFGTWEGNSASNRLARPALFLETGYFRYM